MQTMEETGFFCIEKYFPEVLEAARDRRSNDASETEGKYLFKYGPTLIKINGK